MVEHGAQRPRTVLLGEGGGDAHELIAITHEYRRHTGGHAGEVIDLGELVVEPGRAEIKRWRLQAADRHALVAAQLHTAAETLLEQTGKALRAVTQAAVKGGQLVRQQAGFTAQVLGAGDQVGVVQRTQREHRAEADQKDQHRRQGDGQLQCDTRAWRGHGGLSEPGARWQATRNEQARSSYDLVEGAGGYLSIMLGQSTGYRMAIICYQNPVSAAKAFSPPAAAASPPPPPAGSRASAANAPGRDAHAATPDNSCRH